MRCSSFSFLQKALDCKAPLYLRIFIYKREAIEATELKVERGEFVNIKEVEQATGMSRANIRFYESEGLISPPNNKNGYRNYSEADMTELY